MSQAPHVQLAVKQVKEVMASEGLEKGRKNEKQGYRFRGIDEVLDAVAAPMAKAGLNMYPRLIERTMVEHKSNNGGTLFYSYVHVEYDLVSAVDGSIYKVGPFPGEAFDSGDKSVSKAMSVAYRTACIQVFCIPVNGEEADADKHTSPPVQPREQPRRREPEPPPAAPRSQPLPTKTSKNYQVKQYAEVPFTSMPASALTEYVAHYTAKLPSITQDNHRAATLATIEAAQRELDKRIDEESKSAGATP